jgi:murein DD-endopeptidase MepM/ murein hydrolase activator NlpD
VRLPAPVLPPLLLLALLSPVALPESGAAHDLKVTWQPARPRPGDIALMLVQAAGDGATLEGAVGGRPVRFFSYADGYAALVGFDLDTKPGVQPWRLAVLLPGQPPRPAQGRIQVLGRDFPVQRLTLPQPLVDLDPEHERRALAEGERLRGLYRMITPERLWRGRFVRPVGGESPGTGFGARRIINGQPRSAHAGIDFSAPHGTPVVAVNDGRVALVADFFFPGRLVVLDHGLGLYTLYFHLEAIAVAQDDRVTRGQTIGTVGATGRATGPHLHFGAQVGPARVDPATLLGLPVRD